LQGSNNPPVQCFVRPWVEEAHEFVTGEAFILPCGALDVEVRPVR